MKHILYGILASAVVFLVIIIFRPLIYQGETAAQLLSQPFNWVIIIFAGIATGLASWQKSFRK